jgi:predicted ribosome-associated RNA-binding protein Tma20
MLNVLRHDSDSEVSEAALGMHLQLDLTRPGKPSRMVFNQTEMTFTPRAGAVPVRAVLLGTDHEVTPTYLRKHKRDISLTCYDAFHNTMLDALDTPKVRNWKELKSHLIEANTDVRILGALGLDDYLGHCVLMNQAKAAQVKALGGSRRWAENGADPKLSLLHGEPMLIDPQYEEVYECILDARAHGITFEAGPKDIEKACAEQGRIAIYIVRSGSTVAMTPGLCVVGEEIITSETIVAVNQERLNHNRAIGTLVESLAPVDTDHAPAWRTKLATKLGERLI